MAMVGSIWVAVLLVLSAIAAEAGSPCPAKSIEPCFCFNFESGFTLVVCPGIQNKTHLEEATKPMKSLIIDKLILLNTFLSEAGEGEDEENDLDPKSRTLPKRMFPKKWLAEVRVRELEINNADLNGYFLTDDALEGQSDFMTAIVIQHANLKGHLCSSCVPASGITATSTRELRRATVLKHVDLSHNQLEVLDGNAFPSNLRDLTRVVLSNNHLQRVHDNAFSNLHQLRYVDLSRNRLVAISRKIFRSSDTALHTLDLSYNSIQSLPEDMFHSLSGLKEVRLSHNLLETLPTVTWIRIPALLEKIDLRGNFLVCNCTMNWIARRMSKSTKLLAQCVAPKASEFLELKPSLPTIAAACD